MRREIPKLLLFFCLIPWGAALLVTALDCLVNIMFLDWLWMPDWFMQVFNMLSDYLIDLTAFAMFGIFSAYIFFGKTHKAVILTVSAFVGVFLLPFSVYFIRHMLLTDTMYDTAMLSYYNDAWVLVLILLLQALLFLIAVLLTKFFAVGILRFGCENVPNKMFSLRNPLNFAALLFSSAAMILALVLFISTGAFSVEAIASFVAEIVIDIIRFFVIVFTAFHARKGIYAAKAAGAPAKN